MPFSTTPTSRPASTMLILLDVCRRRFAGARRGGATMALGTALAATAGCGGGEDPAASEPAAPKTVTVTETVESTPTPTPAPTPEADAGTGDSDAQVGSGAGGDGVAPFKMPNEVGKNLQAAQDDLQAASGNPFFYSDSVDATGQERFQALDSGWQVCSQNKRPGTQLTVEDQSILFSVVRITETCP